VGSQDQPLNVLLLRDTYAWSPGTVLRHIRALSTDSRHYVHSLGHIGDLPAGLEIDRFDAIVLHYSIFIFDRAYLSDAARDRIRAFRGVKVVFIQDEHRHINRVVDALVELGVDILFTCVPEQEAAKVYSPSRLPELRKVTVLTGYLDEALAERPVPSWRERTIDVGYRARKLPPWLGSLGREKWLIGDRFAREAQELQLTSDISMREEDRLYGDAWIEFVAGCKAVLGSESGASVFDFTGEIAETVERHVLREPSVTFDELRALYFCDEDGAVDSAVISPRCFEAASLRTLMILYEGSYSGVLEAGRHFVALKKDHSNIGEVVEILRSPEEAARIINNAFEEVAKNPAYSHAALTEIFDTVLAEQASERRPASQPYDVSELNRIDRGHRRRLRIRKMRTYLRYAVSRLVFGNLLAVLGETRRDQATNALRRLYRRAVVALQGES